MKFGTLSPTRIVASCLEVNDPEEGRRVRGLAWRDYCYALYRDMPDLLREPIFPFAHHLEWPGSGEDLQAWQEGRTGFPLIDASMRRLASEGFIDNRARMLVASFLAKHLGVDWREGAGWFLRTLVDGDTVVNAANWQWAAQVGLENSGYVRLFNPVRQSETIDPTGDAIRRYVPELADLPTPLIHAPWSDASRTSSFGVRLGSTYPLPMVDLAEARREALERYRQARADGWSAKAGSPTNRRRAHGERR
jgi:deoxyribodipyrimidine photo-lyase